MKRALLLVAVCLLILAKVCIGQETRQVKAMGEGGFTIGYGSMDVSGLRVFIPSGDGRLITGNQTLAGGTGHGIIGCFVIGGSGYAIRGDELSTDSFSIRLSGGAGTFDIGYLLLDRQNLKLFPMLGVGGGSYGVKIAQRKNISASQVASDPGREVSLGNSSFAFDASLNLRTIPYLEFNEEDNSYGGFMTGISVGYVFSLPGDNWSFSGGDITGGPRFGLNMLYIKLLLGGFGYSPKQPAVVK
jgi:hypothetical protein